MQRLQKNMGDILQPVGSAFQDVFTEIIKITNQATEALMRFFGVGRVFAFAALEKQIKRIVDLQA